MAQDTIGIIGAMESEVAELQAALEDSRVVERAGMHFVSGTLDGQSAVVVRCGIGKVNAGICVQVLVDEFGVDRVVNTGVAGAVADGLSTLDVVVSTDAMWHDFDLTPLGYAPGEVPDLGTVAFPADPALREAAVAAAREVATDATVVEGRVVSGDQFIADAARRERLARGFGGSCCEMEGAAIAQAAFLNRRPFVIVRVISDCADGSSTVDYAQMEPIAASRCASIVRRIASVAPSA